ncbi:MAG: hypothetical protein IJ325_10345 [Clostridia bacterium]|nr:hypothetical protein [Clostridia bacterium]
MKKSLKFLAGALAAVTLLSSAMAVAVSADAAVYTDATVNKAPVLNPFPQTNTVFVPSFTDCAANGFINCSKHNCWWWNNVGSSTEKADYDNLVEVDLSALTSSSDKNHNNNSSTTYPKSNIPWSIFRKGKTSLSEVPAKTPSYLFPTGSGLYNSSCLLIGGKYYPADKISIKKFFENNTFELTMRKGQVHLMNTGYKMYSDNSKVVLCYNDDGNQILKAVDHGTANIYLYTNGGVPFLRLSITVEINNKLFGKNSPVVDIQAADWNLSQIGDSTTISVFATEEYSKDIVVKAVYGKAVIDGNKVIADCNGPIVLMAYSEDTSAVCGFAVLYVGKYTASIIDGTWKPTSSGICGSYWNPDLWCEDGYAVCGWIQMGNIYIPVVKACDDDHTSHLPGFNTKPIKYYTLRELINICRGDLDLVVKLIAAYKESGITYYDEKYSEILKNIKDLDLLDDYFAQLH